MDENPDQLPSGTRVLVRRPSIRGWPQPSVRGTVIGYTETGRVKVETGLGVKVYAAHNVWRRYSNI